MQGALDFQKRLVGTLGAAGMAVTPPYRFRPHMTLSYRVCDRVFQPIEPIGWRVEEFLLIESVHGQGHMELGRWPLSLA